MIVFDGDFFRRIFPLILSLHNAQDLVAYMKYNVSVVAALAEPDPRRSPGVALTPVSKLTLRCAPRVLCRVPPGVR